VFAFGDPDSYKALCFNLLHPSQVNKTDILFLSPSSHSHTPGNLK
jgi:hypothetical protein